MGEVKGENQFTTIFEPLKEKKKKKEKKKNVGAVVWMISAGINIFEIKSTGTFDNFAITQVGMAVFSFAMSFYYSKLYKKEKSEK